MCARAAQPAERLCMEGEKQQQEENKSGWWLSAQTDINTQIKHPSSCFTCRAHVYLPKLPHFPTTETWNSGSVWLFGYLLNYNLFYFLSFSLFRTWSTKHTLLQYRREETCEGQGQGNLCDKNMAALIGSVITTNFRLRHKTLMNYRSNEWLSFSSPWSRVSKLSERPRDAFKTRPDWKKRVKLRDTKQKNSVRLN